VFPVRYELGLYIPEYGIFIAPVVKTSNLATRNIVRGNLHYSWFFNLLCTCRFTVAVLTASSFVYKLYVYIPGHIDLYFPYLIAALTH
jgi:hypothetical protein